MIRKALSEDIEKIRPLIEKLNLDSEDLDCEKFYVFICGGIIAGFGRYKNYGDFYEIATIGVIEGHRNQGIGKALIDKLLNSIPSDEIWLTTIIPEYFLKLGFKISDNIPEPLVAKTRKICKKFNKPQDNSVFMKYEKYYCL